ncbi:MAG TPA: ATP-binding protein [Thermoanaerobaculia bacterium]|nr:ATP-binding protein [Thermoanaerobaculia bacterium]
MSRPAAERRRPPALRREWVVLVPVSLLLLALLAIFTLFSYRNGVDGLLDQRRDEAMRTARAGAARLAAGDSAEAVLSALDDASPGLVAALVVNADGRTVAVRGERPPGDPWAPFAIDGERPAAGAEASVGPHPERLPGAVAAVAPARTADGRLLTLRVDLDASLLAAQHRGLDLLTLLVFVVGGASVLLLLLYLRQVMRPYDALLARAREVGGGDEGEDVDLLLATFERWMAVLARRGGEEADGADDDIAALQRTLAGSLESGLLLLDRDGGVLALNEVGSELLAVAPPPPGTPLADALAEHPSLAHLLADAVRTGQPIQRRECDLVTADGRELTLGLTVHPLRRAAEGEGDGRTVRGFLALFADLTEARRQADEARLEESLVRLGELAAGVAHELRNSLATLRGYLTLIERSPEESAAGYLDEIRHEADHLQRVLEDFLAFASPGSARIEETSLAAVAERAAADPALADTPVRVEAAARPRLRGDPQLLERALRNLLRNAAEAQRESATETAIEVRVETADGGALLTVADRGAGVPPELADSLFHPFVTGRPGGVGLGLALAHRIVSLHGGTLRLEARDGGGTRAVLSFPPDKIVTDGNKSGPSEPPSSPALPAVNS